MNKTFFAIVTLAILLLTSAQYTTPSDARVGYQAPSITLTNSDTTMAMQDLRGKFVLIAFWSSALPETRMANKAFAQLTAERDDIVYLAVNVDRSEGLFHQLIAMDGIASRSQFHISLESQEQIMRNWRQQPEALSAFVINPQGKIIMEAPSLDNLAKL